MAIPDNNLILSSAQAVTATAVSTNTIDQGAAADCNRPLWVEFLVNTTATAAGAATVQFEIQTAIDAAFTTPITLYITTAIAKATLVAGYRVARVKLPITALRFLRANYTVATGPLTAGNFDCRLLADVEILNP